MKIVDIEALQILDSRGNPTLQVEVMLEDGSKGIFGVPSGASTGIHEAHELRDEIDNLYHGKSVQKAVFNIKELKQNVIDRSFTQESLDDLLIQLDGTKNKEKLGANAILGISCAFAKASAKYYNLSLNEYLYRLVNNVGFKLNRRFNRDVPHLFANVINGGLHSGNELNIQEFMIVPTSGNVQERVRMISEVYQTLKKLISEKYGKSNTSVGDEGGFAPEISSVKDALDLLVKAIEISSYDGRISIAMDCAASDFYDFKTKKYEIEKGLNLDHKKLTEFYLNLFEEYPIISIEDPFAEDDFEGFAYFMKKLKKLKSVNPLTGQNNVLVVGDDLLVTNPERIAIAFKKKLCNSLLLKINQIGTLSESIKAFKLSNENGWHTIVSHRSGETIDTFISDLSVALSSSIKLGAPARGERVAKYNRLLELFR